MKRIRSSKYYGSVLLLALDTYITKVLVLVYVSFCETLSQNLFILPNRMLDLQFGDFFTPSRSKTIMLLYCSNSWICRKIKPLEESVKKCVIIKQKRMIPHLVHWTLDFYCWRRERGNWVTICVIGLGLSLMSCLTYPTLNSTFQSDFFHI